MVDFSSEFTNLYDNLGRRQDETSEEYRQRLIASLEMVKKGLQEKQIKPARNMAEVLGRVTVNEAGEVILHPPTPGTPFYTEVHAGETPKVIDGAFLGSMIAATAVELAQYEPTLLSPDNTIL